MKVRKWLSIALAAVLVLSLAGCGTAASDAMDAVTSNKFYSESGGSYDMVYEEVKAQAPSDTDTDLPDGRKWIVTVDMDAETEDLDAMLAQVEQKVAALDGYIEDQNIYNGSAYTGRRYRSASLTIRVPAEQVEQFTEQIEGISNIISKNQTKDDVTLTYVATESRMKALQAEEARLLELMAQAETMSDLLEIESRLTDVRYELESVTSQLRVYDNLVDYATIKLSIDEVQEYTPVEEETLWERISGGFMSSLKGLGNFFVELFVALIVGSPYLIVIGIAVAVIVVLCRKAARKRKANTPPPRPPYPQPPYPMPPQNPNPPEKTE